MKKLMFVFCLSITCKVFSQSMVSEDMVYTIVGNSTSAGVCSTTTQEVQKYMLLLVKNKSLTWKVNTFATSGWTQMQIRNDSTRVINVIKDTTKVQYLFLSEDINSIRSGVIPESLYIAHQTYIRCMKKHNPNLNVVFWTTPHPQCSTFSVTDTASATYSNAAWHASHTNLQDDFFGLTKTRSDSNWNYLVPLDQYSYLETGKFSLIDPVKRCDSFHYKKASYDSIAYRLIYKSVAKDYPSSF